MTVPTNIDIDECINVVRQRVNFGQSDDEIVADLHETYGAGNIFLALRAVEILNKDT